MNKFSQKFDIEKIFEEDFANFNELLWEPLNGDSVFFTLYGRNALFLGLSSLSEITPKREILVPSYSCGDEVRTILNAGFTIKPYRVNVDLQNDEIDIVNKIGENTVAIFITHFLGFPQNGIQKIRQICDEKGIYLIEDCAHCCGGTFHGKVLGTLGDFSVFSLRKSLNILHGGALVLNNKNLKEPEMKVASSELVNMDLFTYLGYRQGYITPGSSISHLLKETSESNDPHSARHDKFGGYSIGISNFAKYTVKKMMPQVDKKRRNLIYSNYLQIVKSISSKKFSALIDTIDNETKPLFFPILVDDSETVYKKLVKNNLIIAPSLVRAT